MLAFLNNYRKAVYFFVTTRITISSSVLTFPSYIAIHLFDTLRLVNKHLSASSTCLFVVIHVIIILNIMNEMNKCCKAYIFEMMSEKCQLKMYI